MAEISRNNTCLAGEYYVAAELYKRGWSVGMTIGNAKAVDLFAEKDASRVAVQVKAIYKRKHQGWPVMKKNIKKECIYVFVNLNGDKLGSFPEFYICTSSEARRKINEYATRGILNIKLVDSPDFRERWDKLESKPYAKKKLVITS